MNKDIDLTANVNESIEDYGRKETTEISFRIAEHLGVIGISPAGWSKELNLISWNGRKYPKYDIREWSPDHTKMTRGITLTSYEMKMIFDFLKDRDIENVGEIPEEEI